MGNSSRATELWHGKTAIITGAASGIGLALAKALVARGAYVVATDVRREAAVAAAESLGSQASGYGLDVRDASAFQSLVTRVANERGRLDFLFNNAGVALAGEVQDLTSAHWERVFSVNLNGVVHGVQAAYPVMLRQRSGHIVNVASLAGLGAAAFMVPYAASKHAVVGLSTSLRVEAADYGVRVTVLCPGSIETSLLDSSNPPDLPRPGWQPDIRRYLTRLVGSPYPADRFADEALDAVAKNKAIAVIPGRARLAWWLMKTAPGFVERMNSSAVRAERKLRN